MDLDSADMKNTEAPAKAEAPGPLNEVRGESMFLLSAQLNIKSSPTSTHTNSEKLKKSI